MPVIITELHVKVNVEERNDRSRRVQRRQSPRSQDALVNACVEKVLEVIEQKDRR